jgi:hypothetical protein
MGKKKIIANPSEPTTPPIILPQNLAGTLFAFSEGGEVYYWDGSQWINTNIVNTYKLFYSNIYGKLFTLSNPVRVYNGGQLVDTNINSSILVDTEFSLFALTDNDGIRSWNNSYLSWGMTYVTEDYTPISDDWDDMAMANGTLFAARRLGGGRGVYRFSDSLWTFLPTNLNPPSMTNAKLFVGSNGTLFASIQSTAFVWSETLLEFIEIVPSVIRYNSIFFNSADGTSFVSNSSGNSVYYWDGSQWINTNINRSIGVFGNAADGTLFAGGIAFFDSDADASAGILRWDGSAWVETNVGFHHYVNAFGNAADGTLFANVFNRENIYNAFSLGILRWDGSAWVETNVSTGNWNTFCKSEDGTLFAGSAVGGGIKRWDGSQWVATNISDITISRFIRI